ncbi:MAG: hypothetical protein U1E05_15775 [Patescibacteria group bacterium]|nr:hypothetical protein [Patescibacteria group bacterium]
MNSTHFDQCLDTAADELNQHEHRHDGEQVVRSLNDGLNVLRDAFYLRIHRDVQQTLGNDSMLMPVSVLRAEQQTAEEIEIYQTAEAAASLVRHGYVSGQDDWCLRWLAGIRLEDRATDPAVQSSLSGYYAQTSEHRALTLTNTLATVLPQSMKAPLVLFRLMPIAVELATALAFDDQETAASLRRGQLDLLPPISYCQDCHGEILEQGQQCQVCGNPLWKHKYLTAID